MAFFIFACWNGANKTPRKAELSFFFLSTFLIKELLRRRYFENSWILCFRFPFQIALVVTLKNTKIYQPEELSPRNISPLMEVFF